MCFFQCRAWARLVIAPFVIMASAAAMPSWAQDDNGVALEFDEAARLAVTAQPLLAGLDAQQRASRESAVSAAQLPDPQLKVGIVDLPVNTGDAYSFTRDSDTQILVGVMQEFPRARKRHLRGEIQEREAERLGEDRGLVLRGIRRDVSLAWLDLWRYEQELWLTRATLREVETQMQAAEIALRTGTATQAEFLAARQEVNRLQDAVHPDRSSQALQLHGVEDTARLVGVGVDGVDGDLIEGAPQIASSRIPQPTGAGIYRGGRRHTGQERAQSSAQRIAGVTHDDLLPVPARCREPTGGGLRGRRGFRRRSTRPGSPRRGSGTRWSPWSARRRESRACRGWAPH